jgi:hypothetical protein
MADLKLDKDEFHALKNEVVLSEKLLKDKVIPQMREALNRYTNKHVPVIARDWDIILNELYPIIQYEIPAIFFRNPRAFLKPRNKTFIAKRRDPVTGEMVEQQLDAGQSAKTQEAILNYKIHEIRYKDEGQRTLIDALIFKYGVMWHGYKGDFGMTNENSLYIENDDVFVRRLSPMHFLHDPSVSLENLDEARWIGRVFYVRKNDLVEDETLDVDKGAIKGELGYAVSVSSDEADNKGGFDVIQLKPDNKALIDYADAEFQKGDASKFVKVYEIWKLPTPKEKRDGEKGKVILFTFDQRNKPLRVSKWPYKAKGFPAKLLMFNYVPDQVYPMADTEVFGAICDHKNLAVNMQLRNAQENSKVYVGISKEGANEEDITKVQEGDQTILTFESGNPRDRMFVQTTGGGASNELYQLDRRIQDNLDEKSGVSDLRKGVLRSGEESATSAQIRASGSSSRPAYRQDIMADFLKESLHFLNQLIKQYMPVTDAVRIVGSLDVEWTDNFTKEEIQAETDIELDVISMLPENPEKEIQELTTVLNLMVQAVNNPQLATKIAQEGKTFNISPIIENLLMRLKIRNPEVFRNIRAEESMGFVGVKDLRDAEANVRAALAGQQPPVMPSEGQDHIAHIETYGSIGGIVKEIGNTIAGQILDALSQAHMALQQELEAKKAPKAGQQVNLGKPKMMGLGV